MKYIVLMVMVFFLVLVTVVATDTLMSVRGNILGISFSDLTGNDITLFNFFGYIMNMMLVFFLMMTFQIPEIPAIVNILVFYPLTIGVVYMVVDIIRGNG